MKSVDIFYKTYRKDFWLIDISLKTLIKNVTGYNQIIIVVPEQDKEFFDTSRLPERTIIYYVEEKQPGWLWQQWCKMQAHKYCFGEFILFADSDCIWDHPINLQDFVETGNPEILYTDYSQLPDAQIWRFPTELFMREKVEWEFMRRNCLIYYRQHLVDIESYEPNLEMFIMESKHFSEFNAIGAFCFKYKRTCYTWINTDDWTYVPPKAEQVWSHATKKGDELHTTEYIRILETVMKAFNVPVPNPHP